MRAIAWASLVLAAVACLWRCTNSRHVADYAMYWLAYVILASVAVLVVAVVGAVFLI